MAATITHRVATPDTGNTPNASGAFSYASGDLLVVFVTKEASVPSTYVSGDLTVASVTGVSSFTLITALGIDGSNIDGLGVWVADQKATGAGAAGVVTIGSGSDAGAGSNIAVFTVAGLHASALGAAAVKQSGSLANQASGIIPSINFATAAADTNNGIVGGIGVVDGTPALTPPTSFNEGADTGYTTGKAQGIETVYRNSGHTSQTVAWVTAATGGAWGGIILELKVVLSRTENRLGTITLTGTRSAPLTHTSKPTGVISLTGTRSESHTIAGPSNTDKVSGTVDLRGGISLRQNFVTNPKAGAGLTTDWTANLGLPTFEAVTLGSGGAPAPSAEMAAFGLTTGFHAIGNGDNQYVYTGISTTTAGDWVGSCYLYISALGGATNVLFGLSDNVDEYGGTYVSTTGTWIRTSYQKLFTAVTSMGSYLQQIGAGTPEWYFTGVLLEQGVSAGTYFDGDLGSWDGTANASTSRIRDESLSHTSKPTGTITLSGARQESLSATQKQTGTVSLVGTRRESESHSPKPIGTVLLQGTVSESYTVVAQGPSNTENREGTITLQGTRRESVSQTAKPSAQVLLQGTLREQNLGATYDRRSGIVTVSGTRRESRSHTSKPTGTIQLQGTVREQNVGPTIDRVSGTITLTGTRRESLERTEKRTGTIVLSGQIDEVFAGSTVDLVTGTITLVGTRRESESIVTKPTGVIVLQGTRQESFGRIVTDRVTGTITLTGTLRETYGRSYTDAPSGTIVLSGTSVETHSVSFIDAVTGTITLLGTRTDSWTHLGSHTGTIVLSGQPGEIYLPSGLVIHRVTGTIRLSGEVVELHSRWDWIDGARWPPDTENRWTEDAGERWPYDSDTRWGEDAGERWEVDLVP